jgi:hypothetical protein
MSALREGLGGRDFHLSVEGLDNYSEVDDQRARLAPAVGLLRSLVA